MKKTVLLKYKLVLIFSFLVSFAIAQTQCGVDTVNYTYFKTTQFRGVSLNASTSGNSFAQWFPAPQAITIEGFDFYAWQSVGTNAVVALTCNIYRSGADSLPIGAPLRSVTVNVDSTFGSGQLTTLLKKAVFSSAITVTTPYIITVENSTATNVSVLANDYAATSPNGRSEWLSSVRIGANYIRSYSINVGGIAFNADFIFRPYVKYTLTSDFSFVGCNSTGNTINFTNKSSDIINSPFYNRYAFYNITQFCFLWDYGDTTGQSYAINGSHKYNYKVDHDVSLKDTLYGWFVGCSDKKTKTVFATPDKPTAHNTGPVCSGDSVHLYVDTLPGTTYVWGGPKGFTSNSSDTTFYNIDTALNGTYGVVAIKNGCPSQAGVTQLLINQTPQTPVASNNGSKCVGDTSIFTATSSTAPINYFWSGPNGFMEQSYTFSFNGVDTTLRGKYIVYVDDGLCKSLTDTVDLYVYPPPQPPVVTATRTTVCEKDTLFLIGNSVAGAVLSWQGPKGFKSSTTNPVLLNASMDNAGTYKAFVIIGSCSSAADSVTVDVNPSPTISVLTPTTNTFCNGDSVTIDAQVITGLSLQWQKDSIDIPNAKGTNYTAKTTGNYRVVAVNSFMCADTSSDIGIIVKPLPTFTQHPTTKLVRNGWDANFTAFSPELGVSYQWQEDKGSGFVNLTNTLPYAGVNTSSLTIIAANTTFNTYQYRCLATLAGCETLSDAGVLTINISVGEVNKTNELKLYPNPASSILTVDFQLDKPQQITYTIVDVLGKLYIEPTTFTAGSQQQHTISVAQLAKGIYFLKLEADGIEKATRFVIE